jgi:hypothetical protein
MTSGSSLEIVGWRLPQCLGLFWSLHGDEADGTREGS